MTANSIRYLYNSNMGIELIFCSNSSISYPTHNHVSVLTVGIVLDGSIALTTGSKIKTCAKNQTFVICPYMPHSISAHNSYTLLSLCIDKNIAARNAADKIRNDIMSLLTSDFHAEKINHRQLLQLSNALDSNVEFSSLAAYANRHSDSQNPVISSLKRQLELYPENKFSIEEMAQNAFVSKYHFIRRFKAEVGLTPHQFQLQNRIRKAQRLMHKAETITEVALATGFCDQSHFIKQFKKQVGLSPLTYKLSSQTIESEEMRQHNAGINFANR